MITLLVDDGDTPADTLTSRTGGHPLAPPGFTWPTCTCGHHHQFLGQLLIDDDTRLLALFMCAHQAGLCDQWDADAGGNSAYLFDTAADLRPVTPAPVPGLSTVSRLRPCRPDAQNGRKVLGGLGGEPSWLQGEHTPECGLCREPMAFVAQLEEGPSTINFGGGLAYVFRCTGHARAKFLWQR